MDAGKLWRRLEPWAFPTRSRARLRTKWEALWSTDAPDEPWMHRPISPQIEKAVDDGWFPAGTPALDVGCGAGEVTHWLSERGFPTLGVDFAAPAIERARARYGEVAGRREFQVLDLVTQRLPERRFGAVVDRGCFHAIKSADAGRYVRNVAAACAPGARFLLYVRAFRRKGAPGGEGAERAARDGAIERHFGRHFEVQRSEEVDLGRPDPAGPDPSMRGLVYWLARRQDA